MDDQLVEERIRRAFAVIADEIDELDPGHQGRWLIRVGGGVLAAAAISLGLVLVGGPSERSSEPRSDVAAAAQVLDRLGSQAAAKQGWTPKNLAEALPNQPLRMPDGKELPASDAVVSGRVIAAVPGAGYVQPTESDDASPVEVSFNSPRADFIVARLTIEVDEAVGLEAETVDVGVRFVGSPHLSTAETKEIVTGLQGLGTVLVVLSKQGDFPLDRDLYRISNETLIGLVGPDGQVVMPAQSAQNPTFLKGLATVDEIIHQARLPERPGLPLF